MTIKQQAASLSLKDTVGFWCFPAADPVFAFDTLAAQWAGTNIKVHCSQVCTHRNVQCLSSRLFPSELRLHATQSDHSFTKFVSKPRLSLGGKRELEWRLRQCSGMVLSLAESGADSSGRLLAGVDKDISEDANTRKIAERGEGVFFFMILNAQCFRVSGV